jgi:hypothetical protein
MRVLMTSNEIRISIIFTISPDGPIHDINYWSSEFKDKMDITAVDYDQFWSENSSRLEFKGLHKEKV